LQRDGTVAHAGLVALAIRIETLVITSHDAVIRPPREVALALALYLDSLADSLPRREPASPDERSGRALFESHCTRCHVGVALSGAPIALDFIGTDPTLGRSLERGTGGYRVPSLHGVGDRGPLLHHGAIASLEELFDAARVTPDYSLGLHGAGAIAGHTFGLDFSPSDRAALLAYLRTL
jgi:hypothetical protein